MTHPRPTTPEVPKRQLQIRLARLLATLALLFTASTITVLSAKPASADTTLCTGSSYSTCINAGYTDHGYGTNNLKRYWGADAGHNCTNYVAYVETQDGATAPSYQLGNADQWYASASGHVNESTTTPVVGSAAWWGDATWNQNSGHVAYVEAVTGAPGSYTITVSEDAFSSGPFDWKQITQGSGYWPGGFIYFENYSSGSSAYDKPLLGDVNGDGKADAVLVNPGNGHVWVGLSNGSGFSTPASWSSNPIIAGATRYFLADVNGDGRADIVAYFASTGTWYVGLSSGSGFWPPVSWASNEGSGSSNQFLADVDGDGRADVVTFNASSGNWYVDTSSGSGFWGPPSLWISGNGVGSSTQVVGDFNGDGKADAGVYVASTGDWYVGLSTGTYFGYPGQWSVGHGMNSNQQLVGDVDGDGKADIGYFYNNGAWEVGTSSGSGFWQPTYWAYGEGNGGTTQFLANVSGGSTDAVVTYWETAGVTPAGTWSVDTSSGSGFYGPPSQWTNGFGDNYS